MNYYLAIDQGTHSSRAMLYNEKGVLQASQVEPVSLFYRENGHIEQDPVALLHSVRKALNRLLGALSTTIKQHIHSCGLTCQRSTLVVCDKQGSALSPAISWQDTRGQPYLTSLSLSAERVQTLSGLPLSSHYSASKFRWLLDHHPALKGRPTDSLYLAPLTSFLLLHLTQDARFVIDHSHAQRTQLMDIQQLDWSEDLTTAYHIPVNSLPLCKPMCDDYGLLENTSIPITAVCGDQNAALLGSGMLNNNSALINLGSGAFVLRKLPTFKRSTQLLTGIAYSSRYHQKVDYLREATINGAGNALSWFHQQQQWNEKEIEQWQQQLPGWLESINNPPLFINTVGGLGSPWWSNPIPAYFEDEDDSPLNNEEHNSKHIGAKSVAIIESILFLIEDNLRIMTQEHPLTLLTLSGGLSQQDGLCQKLANLSQLPVQRLSDKETTARGIAWLSSQPNDKNEASENKAKTPWAINIDQTFQPIEDKALEQRYQKFHHQLTRLTS